MHIDTRIYTYTYMNAYIKSQTTLRKTSLQFSRPLDFKLLKVCQFTEEEIGTESEVLLF